MATDSLANTRESKKSRKLNLLELAKLSTVQFSQTIIELADNEFIQCDSLVRHLSNNRLVLFGRWENKEIVAKIFYHPFRQTLHVQRELNGYEILKNNKVPTPTLLLQSKLKNHKAHIIIYEKINKAVSLATIQEHRQHFEKYTLVLQAFVIELATQHVLGIVQKDLHLKNFLLKQGKMITLDVGSIERSGSPLSKKESLQHFALFYAQLGSISEDLHQLLLKTYTQSRGWMLRDADLKHWQKLTKRTLQNRWQRYKKKIFRHATNFKKIRTLNTYAMLDKKINRKDFLNYIHHPDLFFKLPSVEVLKNGGSTTVIKFQFDEKQYVLKRYNTKNLKHRIRIMMRPSRALCNWVFSHFMLCMGLPTAQPVAFIETSSLKHGTLSYFLMEYIEGCDLNTYLQNHNEASEPIMKQVIALLGSLKKLSITHGDWKFTNILIKDNQVYLIDLDGMRKHFTKMTLAKRVGAEIKRFLQNLDDRPTLSNDFTKLLKENYLS